MITLGLCSKRVRLPCRVALHQGPCLCFPSFPVEETHCYIHTLHYTLRYTLVATTLACLHMHAHACTAHSLAPPPQPQPCLQLHAPSCKELRAPPARRKSTTESGPDGCAATLMQPER